MADRFRSIADTLCKLAMIHPEKRALVCGADTITYGQLETRSNEIANRLIAESVNKGDRIAVLAANCITYYVALLGIVKAHGSAVPLPTMVTPNTIATMLEDSRTRLLFASQPYLELAEQALDLLPKAKILGLISFDDAGPSRAFLESWIAGASSANPELPIQPDSEFNIIYSSGTTGRPKGIIHDHTFRTGDADGMAGDGFDRANTTVVTTALYSNWSVFAFLASLQNGGTTIILPKFDVEQLLQTCSREQPKSVFLVPVQVNRILDHKTFDSYDLGVETEKWVAGSPFSARRKRELVERWPGGVSEIYGMTEGTPSTKLSAHKHPDKLESVGKPDIDTVIKIIDENGVQVPANVVGEVVGHGPTMMTGYNNRPNETQHLIWTDDTGVRYFKSGDLGYLDTDGFLFIVGRKKDVIISGGLNIYPADIESILNRHSAVKESAVFGVENEDWGESPIAAIETTPVESAPSETDLVTWANRQLGPLQKLHGVVFVESLPRNALGKILKKELRKNYAHLFGD